MTNNKIDIETLLSALENDNNEGILEYDKNKINEIKNNILEKLNLPEEIFIDFQRKLEDYKYIDELPDLQQGRYIRWISTKPSKNENLATGGIVCDIKVVNEGINIICKNKFNRFFEIKMNDNIIFQKITKQEKVLLDVMNYLNK
jgi:hypothetical protein